MIIVIFLTSFITIIVLLVTSAIYLIALICNESDDSNDSDSLILENNLFTPSPGVLPQQNPICENPNHHHHDDSQQDNNEVSDKTEVNESSKETKYNGPTQQNITSDTKTYGSLESESNNSDFEEPESKNQAIKSNSSKSIKETADLVKSQKSIKWNDPVAAQKSLITNNLGATVCKQLFDDFDPRDMQLGGNGLHWCKQRKSLERLIKLGVPIDSLNWRHETPLHVAIRRKRLQILIGLLSHGADVESRNESGETPLILACRVNDLYACQTLLIFDAKVDSIDDNDFSARHYIAGICNKYKGQEKLPSAAHIILAMLNEMGAKRCPEFLNQRNSQDSKLENDLKTETVIDPKHTSLCSDGCSHAGNYNGNSYNRWPNFKRESLYKKFMFHELIEGRKKRKTVDESKANELKQPSRILCIDGGGMRGVIACQTMIELEKYLKKPLISYFDWIGGTSVGAFLSCALCNGTSLAHLRRISFNVKDEVFSGNKPYNSKFLEQVFKRTFGPTTRMSNVKDKKLAVTTVIADREPCQLRFFRNYRSPIHVLESYGFSPEVYNSLSSHSNVIIVPRRQSNITSNGKDSPVGSTAKSTTNSSDDRLNNQAQSILEENDQDPLMWQAVRASAAAPFFFKPYGPYLDGGIISNNPTLDMLTEFHAHEKVKSFLRTAGIDCSKLEPPAKLDLVLSLGTGRGRVISRQDMIDFSNITAGFTTVFSPLELVKSIKAVRDLFKKVMQQSCQTEDYILDRAQAWCSSIDVAYFRVNPPLAAVFSIDDKRDEQLINALWQTKLYMHSVKDQLKEFAVILDGEEATEDTS